MKRPNGEVGSTPSSGFASEKIIVNMINSFISNKDYNNNIIKNKH